ncbi:hypothetical protein KIPB_011073 [Kipferlia bialata]|uniref:Uncharacterized protein n=1 Tax=Kipferlia bialata TaxID=797122 RepID=A0A9K3D7P5_9EUKA|nr:hypothetical protein KIPB_011073 [Kipferlia bialata]|eukprot:g11073.t1
MSDQLLPDQETSDTLQGTLDQVWRDRAECDKKWEELYGKGAPDPFLDPAKGGDIELYREAVELDKRVAVVDCLHNETLDVMETLSLDRKWYEMENENLAYALECALEGNTTLAVAHKDRAAEVKEARLRRPREAAVWWKRRRNQLLKEIEERERERQMEWREGGGEIEGERQEGKRERQLVWRAAGDIEEVTGDGSVPSLTTGVDQVPSVDCVVSERLSLNVE